jgi:hypothetical protein
VEYATTQADAVAPKPLETLAGAVQRVDNAGAEISRFVDRFHGQSPADLLAAPLPAVQAAAPPYGNTLEKLFSALERLETRIDALNAIG